MMTPQFRTPQITFGDDPGTPKYVAIAKALGAAIADGDLAEGALLPSQRELSESFQVTIMTVRQAISMLTEQGLVAPSQGRGTYVTRKPYALPLGPLASFAAHMRQLGRSLQTRIVDYGAVDISPLEQSRMALPKPRAFEIVRLRIVDDAPVVLQTSLVTLDVGEQLDVQELAHHSLYDAIRALGVRIDSASETVQATTLDAEEAGLLDRPHGEAALISARLTRDVAGRPVMDDRALTAGNRVVIAAERKADETGILLSLTDAVRVPVHRLQTAGQEQRG